MVRGPLGWVGRVVSWLVILSVVVILVVAVLIPRLGGATPYTILTGSMKPDMPPGTLVVVRPVDEDDVRVGSVITYQRESGKATVVTHRVVAKGFNSLGEIQFQTQGDANDTADEEWVRPVQVKGEKWYSVRYLGYVNNMLNGKERQMAVYAVAALLLGYAAFMLTGAVRDRRKERAS
ncbi:signal peptidase I [Nocardioides sp. Root151]|uniref:signal peptidase I n=1 Tax=Nocardioides sp. Root151 TaxID=1736475 RepID=UPI000703A5D8|nr:signal peptidase I [Nocardioides sp. Root151]KQZ70125.1 S26 family signal peptidase [Nocardioides sp. Root151]